MESYGLTLRPLLGRTPHGLYALSGDGAPPSLLCSGAPWPPAGVDPHALLGSLPLPRSGGPAAPVDAGGGLLALPLGAGGESPAGALSADGSSGDGGRGALLIQAGRRSPLRRRGEADWDAIAAWCSLAVSEHEARTRLASARVFAELLLDRLPLGIMVVDSLGRVRRLSGPAEAILGYRNDEAAGMDCLRIFRPAGLDANPLRLRGRKTSAKVELYLNDRDGNEKPVWIQVSRIPEAAGEAAGGLFVLLRDTTEERGFEEEMRRRERLASIGELAAGVAHEIRNPLTGIGNCAQVLRDRVAPEDPMQKMVQIILDETRRLDRIVESLLHFSRPGRPQLKECDPLEIVGRVLELQRDGLAEAGVGVETKTRGRIPRIFIDPDQIAQILLNVIRNAADAMASGGRLRVECGVIRRRPHLRRGTGQRKTDRIRLADDAPTARYVQIRIADTGGGIPADVLPRIFDPFFTTRPKGTGLGLSITGTIVREHGGYISIRSVEGKGTIVTIDLPVERRHGERRRAAG